MSASRSLQLLARVVLAASLVTMTLVMGGAASPASAADGYRALAPARVLDTRQGLGASGPVGPGGEIRLDVTGVGGVPESGVAAVVLNVTAAEASAATYVTVWPTGRPKPDTSNLNVQPGVDTPNLVIATVGADGTIQLANQFGSVHLIADISGWFGAGSDYQPLSPARVLDSRRNLGAPGPVAAGDTISVDVTGVAGVPPSGVAAVVLNVTAVEATAGTYVTVWPTGQDQPNTSNLNVQPGVDTPNLVIATVGADGTIQLANQFGSVQLIADVTGWFPTGAGYQALSPGRVLDTRIGAGAQGPVGPGATISVDVTGVAGVPASGVGAVVLNVTAAESTAGTYVTVWPTGQDQPNTSNLNVQPGVDTPNLVIATVGTDGTIQLANQFGSTQLIADVTGWFPGVAVPPVGRTGTLYYDGLASLDRLDLASGTTSIVYDLQDDDSRYGYNATEFAFATDVDGGVTRVEIRDLATGLPVTQFELNVWATIQPVLPSPDGRWIAMVIHDADDIGGPDRLLVVERDGTPRVAYDGVKTAAWTSDGRLAFVNHLDGTTTLGIFTDFLTGDYDPYWSASSPSFDDAPDDLALSPDGTLASFSRLGRIYGLRLDGAAQPYVVAESAVGLAFPAFSPDSTQLVVHRDDGAFCSGSMHIVPAAPAEPLYLEGGDSPTIVRNADGNQESSCGSLFWHP